MMLLLLRNLQVDRPGGEGGMPPGMGGMPPGMGGMPPGMVECLTWWNDVDYF